jgi:signal transduction histidine kinase
VRSPAGDDALLGVGVAGMRARLLQFGGRLVLLSGRRGTMVVALLPLGSIPAG